MSIAQTIQPLGGGAPAPEATRVAAIRAAMTEDAEAGATFAEPICVSLAALVERGVTAFSTAPHAEAATLLTLVRDRLAGLRPERLEPRGGLAGLFDSRSKRLRAFRAAFASASDASLAASSDLLERAGTIERRGADLEAVWAEIREAVTDLDAHIAAARDALSSRPLRPMGEDAVPPEAAAAFEDTDAQAAAGIGAGPHHLTDDGPIERQADAEAAAHVREPAAEAVRSPEPEAGGHAGSPTEPEAPLPVPIATLPHPLEARMETLLALRAAAVARLPLIRAAQNADQGVPKALASARNAIEAWAAETREALGLSGKRPRKVRPDLDRLREGRDALIAQLSSAEGAAAVAQARLSELDARVVPSEQAIRIAA